ncbi:MAG: carbohydrate-binding domain-containing protein [Tetragenococcus koreensis]|nr:carbohydrate-binding domain-containing protein [Tetragenococcus koreensis]
MQTADGYDDSSVSVDESYKGLKAGGNIELVSDTITINSADDLRRYCDDSKFV